MNRYAVALLAFAFLTPGCAFAYTSPGSPNGYVTDFADILSPETESVLEAELQAYEASTTIEIAVATVNTLDGDDVAVYGNELFREWGVGQKNTNNGVLLVIAPNERQMRIEVGYGLEGAIPDITAKQILDIIITPAFKAENYDGGVLNGVHALQEAGRGEFVALTVDYPSNDKGQWFGFLVFLPFILIFLVQILTIPAAILARSNSWWAGGILGICGGVYIAMNFFQNNGLAGALTVFGLTIFGLVFDFIVSKNYRTYKDFGIAPPWYFGGERGIGIGGFGGGSSGGGGGFGGGSSGGGGASGSW